MAGRDPRMPPQTTVVAGPLTVPRLLDRYLTNHVIAEGLSSESSIRGFFKAISGVLGDCPASHLEKPEEIVRFKAYYREGREVSTVNRDLANLRAAITWVASRIRRC